MSTDAAALEGLLDRFATACHADDRILAGLLTGSHASGSADQYSDVDLVVVAADGARDAVWAEREEIVQRLGTPLQLETFDGDDTCFFILADGTDAELTVTDQRGLPETSIGPYRAIADPGGILRGVEFVGRRPDESEQVEQLRRQVHWFWHDMGHFIAAMGRGQAWWAAGQLDALRRYAVNLARLHADFAQPVEDFDKLDLAVPARDLAPLATTFAGPDRDGMITAARTVADYYHAVAPGLASEHGVAYPAELERIMQRRLDALEP